MSNPVSADGRPPMRWLALAGSTRRWHSRGFSRLQKTDIVVEVRYMT